MNSLQVTCFRQQNHDLGLSVRSRALLQGKAMLPVLGGPSEGKSRHISEIYKLRCSEDFMLASKLAFNDWHIFELL